MRNGSLDSISAPDAVENSARDVDNSEPLDPLLQRISPSLRRAARGGLYFGARPAAPGPFPPRLRGGPLAGDWQGSRADAASTSPPYLGMKKAPAEAGAERIKLKSNRSGHLS